MNIEIDVSGADLFHENYVICASDSQGIIRGFKFSKEIINKLKKNWKKGKYNKCPYSPNAGKFKVRIYRVVLRYLLKQIFKLNNDKKVKVVFCNDFKGHENGISQSLEHVITQICKKKLISISCSRLTNNSDAHMYAYIMNKDKYNYLSCFVNLKLKDIEKGLIFHKKK